MIKKLPLQIGSLYNPLTGRLANTDFITKIIIEAQNSISKRATAKGDFQLAKGERTLLQAIMNLTQLEGIQIFEHVRF